mgnify:CR=1 FL=1
MKNLLKDLYNHKIMSKEESKAALISLTDGSANSSQISSFLTVFLMRDITSEELDGFREAMIELSLNVDIDGDELIDLCGTGGDGKDTFNISTISSFVVAGAGIRVAKHGNYGVSSSCGSSNIISHLGHEFSNDVSSLKYSLDKSNICFLHAPLFHPSLKNISPIRSELGVKTFFNMLGPMVNPIQPKSQLVGVFNSNIFKFFFLEKVGLYLNLLILFEFFFNLIAKVMYPFKTSRTFCHGRVELGFLINTFSFFDQAFIQSGTIRSSDQSPPPITLPALADAIFTNGFC